MFTDDFRARVEDGTATVECRGLRWQVSGWLGVPEMSRDDDEVRFAGPAEGDPGVWLELRHSFDRTWQIRLSASSNDWADWPGARVSLTHIDRVYRGALTEEDADLRRSGGEAMWTPVWTWHLGSAGWLLVADHYDKHALFGTLRRGIATDTDQGVRVPPARLRPGENQVTAWSVQELFGVGEAHGLLPAWLPSVTGVATTAEIALNAPDHGLVPGEDLRVTEEDGLTLLTHGDSRGGISEVLLHGAGGTVTLPLAFGTTPAERVADWARDLLERNADAEELAAEDAVILSSGASAGVADAGELLADLAIRTTGGAEQPLVVGACAMELARTGDQLWAGRLATAVEHLPAVPGAVSALVRAVVGSFAVDGDPHVYLDRIADLERAAVGRRSSVQDSIVALEVAAVGGWVYDTMVEQVAGLLGWGLPLSPLLPVDSRTAVQAIAAMSLVDERVVPHWAISPSVITAQAMRWMTAAEFAGADWPRELAAWLLLPVTE